MRIECRLRTSVQYHIIQHSEIQQPKGMTIRTGLFGSRPTAAPETKNSYAEAAARVTVITGSIYFNTNYQDIIGQAIPDSQVISRRTPTEPTSG